MIAINQSHLLDRYRKLHSGVGYYLFRGVPKLADETLWDGNCVGRKILPLLERIVHKRESFRVLDWGCGKAKYSIGRFGGKVQEWYLYDPGYEPYSAAPRGLYDYIVCADVMEHIIDVEPTLENMARHLDKNGIAIFAISGCPDLRQFFEDGLNMHVTQKTVDEWKVLLKKHFRNKKAILIYNNKIFWESWHAPI